MSTTIPMAQSSPVLARHTWMLGVLWLSTTTVAITSIHHLHGARIYDTPQRYHAVWIALVGILIEVIALIGTFSRSPRSVRLAQRTFAAAATLFFVLMFGLGEGLVTHVVAPLLAGGYGSAEPYDALFEGTRVFPLP